MSVLGISESTLREFLDFFAKAWIYTIVFMAIVTNIKTIQRVIFNNARLVDHVVFVVLFGLFSIFGTYAGIQGSQGSISNFRNFAPIVAGLVGGPYVGLAVGLIGGIQRLFLGGVSYVPCSLATVLAGLLAGIVYRLADQGCLKIAPVVAAPVMTAPARSAPIKVTSLRSALTS